MKKYINFFRGMLGAARSYARNEIELNRIHKYDKLPFTEVYEDLHKNYAPCFVLSTGRAGTKLMTKLFEGHEEIKVYHEPFPEITHHSEFAYHNQDKADVVKEVIDALRYEHIRNSALLGKKYLETNNRITFFARQIAELYPNSKFIHIYRKPIKFVESGLGRNWYSGTKLYDEGRITPGPNSGIDWKNFSQVQKIAWLWNETNKFVDEFKKEVDASRLMTMKAEEFFKDPKVGVALMKFVGVTPHSESKVASLISRPVNKQPAAKKRSLSEEEIAQVKALCPLGESYYPNA